MAQDDLQIVSSRDFADWLANARVGSTEALGRLLETFRTYLSLIASEELDSRLLPKAGVSDLVQETFIEAQRDFSNFHGRTKPEWQAWLGRMLRHNIDDFRRRYYETDKREIKREMPLDQAVRNDPAALVAAGAIPSQIAAHREESARLEQALARLPSDYQQVIRYRNHRHWTFEEIGLRLGRTADAVRKLWGRAIKALQQELKTPDGPGLRRKGKR
jgi:RNA polymerase sigma-70 factor (ECF subfamily)